MGNDIRLCKCFRDGKLKNPDKNPLLSQGNMETPEVGIKEERELNKGTVSVSSSDHSFKLNRNMLD